LLDCILEVAHISKQKLQLINHKVDLGIDLDQVFTDETPSKMIDRMFVLDIPQLPEVVLQKYLEVVCLDEYIVKEDSHSGLLPTMFDNQFADALEFGGQTLQFILSKFIDY
jgi:hypothetical protein